MSEPSSSARRPEGEAAYLVCGYRPRWALLAPLSMFRCGKPEGHDGYHGEWT